MQGPQYKFYIKNLSGQYYFIDDLNTVQITATKTPIKHAPKGWSEMLAGIYRNDKYRANFTKVATPLQFVLDAKKICDYLFVFEGPNAYANLSIDVQVSNDFSYQLFFDGKIDFQGYKLGETYSTGNIRESAVLDTIEAKEDIVYEIELNDTNSVTVGMDGIDLSYISNMIVSDGFGTSANWNTGDHVIELLEASNENPDVFQTERTKYNLFPNDVPGTSKPFFKAAVAQNITIELEFDFFAQWLNTGTAPPPDIALRVQFVHRKDGQSPISQAGDIIFSAFGSDNIFSISYLTGKNHSIKLTYTTTLDQFEDLYFCCNPTGSGIGVQPVKITYSFEKTKFRVTSIRRSEATVHKGIKPWKLWQELVFKATNGKYSGVSPFLFMDDEKILIPGTGLRREERVYIQTTIKEFLKYCYVIHLGVLADISGNNIEIKNISDTYLNAKSLDLGSVSNLEVSASKEHLISTIKVGYNNIDFGVDGQINGKDEFNQLQYYTTGQDEIKAEYDIVCPYIASIYSHEMLRVNFYKRSTTDNKGDNKVYLLDAQKGANLFYFKGEITGVNANTIQLVTSFVSLNVGDAIIISGSQTSGTFIITNIQSNLNGTYNIQLNNPVTIGTYQATIYYTDSNAYSPKRLPYQTLTGVLSPSTVYNVEVSPKSILLKHDKIISGGVYNSQANNYLDTIKFQSGDKNVLLERSLDNIFYIKENTDLSISTLSQPYYLPIELSFTTDYIDDVFVYLRGQRKYEYIHILWNGFILNGFILDIESNADNDSKQNWKLLCTISSNITNIVL